MCLLHLRPLLHLRQNVITFKTLLQLGMFITFRPSTTDNFTCRPKTVTTVKDYNVTHAFEQNFALSDATNRKQNYNHAAACSAHE